MNNHYLYFRFLSLICVYTIWFDLIWFDLIWFDLIWFDLIWFDFIWFDFIWFDLIWFDLIWFDLTWFDLIWLVLFLFIRNGSESHLNFFNLILPNITSSYLVYLKVLYHMMVLFISSSYCRYHYHYYYDYYYDNYSYSSYYFAL